MLHVDRRRGERHAQSGAPSRAARMDWLNGLNVPQPLGDLCRPESLGLIAYDTQVGTLEQIIGRTEGHPTTSKRFSKRQGRPG